MDLKKISLAPLEHALQSLLRATAQPKNEFNRDSVIQRFEYTFELSWKAMAKVLSADRPLEDQSVKGILRESAKQGLISNLPAWFEFQEARNITSHTYNEKTADEVYVVALRLPPAVITLITQLKDRLKKI